MRFSNKEGITVVHAIIEEIVSNRDYLSKVDAAVGDGDHGINMSKGFNMADKEIAGSDLNMNEGFLVISKTLISKIGGSMGPLYGNFFRGLSVASKEKEMIDSSVILEMLKKAYSNITLITDASEGDKTLIDVLSPAITAYKINYKNDHSLPDCLNEMMAKAKEGLENTKNMTAKVGRGSRLGDRTLGHQDAGATSCYLILKAFSSSITKIVNAES
ncbi:dihydroxyacetone kinase subunit DhaL [Oceanobacillus sp. CFH 90083]|uniref:dihydroxyacetone kinase subunit DhaL n=1 Tax=Oceanobacillus sp. CFH 90083 TaxID=2592336 RepID=UPI00128BC64D|nr:dihydroxyacetone kinase subunit DhaL [Oceanobacillus sp. CFH 90083]